MGKQFASYFNSPIGKIKLTAEEDALTLLSFVSEEDAGTEKTRTNKIITECKKQLKEYFAGKRKKFDVPLKLDGTEFQKKVWKQLLKIPFGKTAAYGEIAKKIKNEKASRAVGGANNKNKIAIIIPCHRVIGTDGSLTGYAGGLDVKEWLLKHEAKFSGQ